MVFHLTATLRALYSQYSNSWQHSIITKLYLYKRKPRECLVMSALEDYLRQNKDSYAKEELKKACVDAGNSEQDFENAWAKIHAPPVKKTPHSHTTLYIIIGTFVLLSIIGTIILNSIPETIPTANDTTDNVTQTTTDDFVDTESNITNETDDWPELQEEDPWAYEELYSDNDTFDFVCEFDSTDIECSGYAEIMDAQNNNYSIGIDTFNNLDNQISIERITAAVRNCDPTIHIPQNTILGANEYFVFRIQCPAPFNSSTFTVEYTNIETNEYMFASGSYN